MEKAKGTIIEQLNYCKEIAEDIIKNNASMEILQHAKKFAEIESPMTGEMEKLNAITEEALVVAHYGEYFPVSPEPYKEYVA